MRIRMNRFNNKSFSEMHIMLLRAQQSYTVYFDQILVIHTPLEKTTHAGVLEKILDLSPHFGSFLIRYTDGVKVISMIFDYSLTPYQIEMNTKL